MPCIDRAVQHVLRTGGAAYRIEEFQPYGYDERQYGSPGINLPVGCLMRSAHGTFPEYHTSADNLDFIKPEFLADTLTKAIEIVEVLEHNACFVNLKPMCEPRLGKYGLYGAGGGQRTGDFDELALLWVLNQSDGGNDLLAIAERSGMTFRKILTAAEALEKAGLLRRENPRSSRNPPAIHDFPTHQTRGRIHCRTRSKGRRPRFLRTGILCRATQTTWRRVPGRCRRIFPTITRKAHFAGCTIRVHRSVNRSSSVASEARYGT